MTTRDITDLYAYTDWADDRTLSCAETLNGEAWAQDLGGSFPSLGATLAHIVGAEWVWLRRWTGTSATGRPAWVDHPAPAPLRAALLELQRERNAFLSRLTEADLPRPLTYTLFNGTTASLPLGALLLHVVNHSTYHRGQAASMLRRLGATPPPTDYLIFATDANEATHPAG